MSSTRQHAADPSDKLYIGIDAGSVSLNCVVIDGARNIVFESPYERHLGRVEITVVRVLEAIFKRFEQKQIAAVAFTGNHGRHLSTRLDAYYEFETISQVLGARLLQPDVKSIISMGGQDTALLQLRYDTEGWELEYFNTNGPCASGTGSFIDQQAQRLATALYSHTSAAEPDQIDAILADFIALGRKSQKPASVACRCTVFTKSDMIHLQNKGERLEDIIWGLHMGNARNYISTIVCNRTLQEPILFIGGMAMNTLQVNAFREYFPKLVVPPHAASIGAVGVALQAQAMGLEKDFDIAKIADNRAVSQSAFPRAERLVLQKTRFPASNAFQPPHSLKNQRVFLGLDIGSTTTKYALITEDQRIIHKCYRPTRGKPVEVTQELLRFLKEGVGTETVIDGVATTGSGRNVVGDFLNVDLIIDEITAHARGAVAIDPGVDTIFEIGGQDSKYISLVNTHPLDFDMNKVCAAGTGSFLHELANKYGINIVKEFEQIALSAENPIKLAERCTVFMESDLVSYHQQGAATPDLMGGLCYAIVYNYLNRVVGKRAIGRRVMFLGGPSLNRGVVAAFENVLGHGLVVPQHREVLGAFGAAISVLEKMTRENRPPSTFRGVDSAIRDQMAYQEKICRADPQCHNQCKLKIYNFDGRRSVWGGECGRYEMAAYRGPQSTNYFTLRDEIWRRHLQGVVAELADHDLVEVDGRPTVGMQRALYGLQTSVMWAHFFDQLGFRLVLTPPTNPQISKAGIESMVAETCYPVKVSHGHVRTLKGRTAHLFLPVMINMATVSDGESGFYCPLVQSNTYFLMSALGLDRRAILAPTVRLNQDPATLALTLYEQIGPRLKVDRRQVRRALETALARHHAFLHELQERGTDILRRQDPNTPVIIVTGRPYNLYDERLNLRLGQNLGKIGMDALPMDFIDAAGVDLSDFPNMYWGLGAQILRTAKIIRNSPRYFGLHLTNFECGADSFIEHFYRHIMGDKPYLILELDEHSAVAGVMTRLEAYRHVIENAMADLRAAANCVEEMQTAN